MPPRMVPFRVSGGAGASVVMRASTLYEQSSKESCDRVGLPLPCMCSLSCTWLPPSSRERLSGSGGLPFVLLDMRLASAEAKGGQFVEWGPLRLALLVAEPPPWPPA